MSFGWNRAALHFDSVLYLCYSRGRQCKDERRERRMDGAAGREFARAAAVAAQRRAEGEEFSRFQQLEDAWGDLTASQQTELVMTAQAMLEGPGA